MKVETVYTRELLLEKAKKRFAEERGKQRLDGWFLVQEIWDEAEPALAELPAEQRAAELLKAVAERIPLSLSEHAVFAGTEDDAFARSYALINPSFTVKSFNGYCDPTAVFHDIQPCEEISAERIESLRARRSETPYVRALKRVYEDCARYTEEVTFFVEQVTGHTVADFRPALQYGLDAMIAKLRRRAKEEPDALKRVNLTAFATALSSALVLADRYAALAAEHARTAAPQRRAQLELMREALSAPHRGCRTLFEAMQTYLLLWQVMCLEQSPNPFAFSVGNADRIFEPYRSADGLNRDLTAGLFAHFLTFFNVGDRSWAISQNILLGGRDAAGRDLTNLTTYAILDAFYRMNLPQPILSVKLHRATPTELQRSLGRFFFTPGALTPSLFNDDALFPILSARGVSEEDLADYAVAGCQEPLIMGKDNGNTTNSWLNLGKILELALHDGVSALSGRQVGFSRAELGFADSDPEYVLRHIREIFYRSVEVYAQKMRDAANAAAQAVSLLPVPFLSAFMGGAESGYDMRDTAHQGTKYAGSGCLVHGLSVVADSFLAIDCLLEERKQDCGTLLKALRSNFQGFSELAEYLKACPKYGNNLAAPDAEAAEIASKVCEIVSSLKNCLGQPFRPDFSTPSTHLLYGYWVGATPDGRGAREMLGYGVDPLYGEARAGLGMRVLSQRKLPYKRMGGGCASHLGIDPNYFRGKTQEEKGEEFCSKVVNPLFFSGDAQDAPFYVYVNVTTPDTLRKVLREPEKYAPNGVYIVRIHGTFVNFLDLSSEIQEDIIRRLDPGSTSL